MIRSFYLDRMASLLPPKWQRICSYVLNDDLFYEAPGSAEHHHVWRGGLCQHTEEVVKNCLKMTPLTEEHETNMAIMAGIFHDYCKIYEFAIGEDGKVTKFPYRKLIGHVVGSWEKFMQAARRENLDEDTTLQIGHALLAHHGRLEWRSPVEPQTALAFILHSADMLSMQNGSKKEEQL